jgi:DnaJ-class molecular chaperone
MNVMRRRRLRCSNSPLSLFLFLAVLFYESSIWLLLTKPASASATSRDYYKVLGVRRDDSAKDIQRAYRKLALRHHPDKGGNEETFKKINEAYDVLSDDTKRRQYDQFGHAGSNMFQQSHQQQHASHTHNPFNVHQEQQQRAGGPQFTSSFFSFGGGNPQQFTGNPFQNFGVFFDQANDGPHPQHVDLGDLLRQMMGGSSPTATYSSTSRNSASGKKGKSRGRDGEPSTNSNSYTRNLSCSLEELAQGATKKLKVRHKVHGQWHEQIYQIVLQPHWKTGTKVRFPARPLPTTGSFPAMTFVIQETPHSFLERRDGGADVWYTCHITRRQAQEGLRLSIPCVLLPHDRDDHVMEVVLTPQSHPRLFPIHTSDTVTIPHRGMPRKRQRRHEDDNDQDVDRGNLLVEFVVD